MKAAWLAGGLTVAALAGAAAAWMAGSGPASSGPGVRPAAMPSPAADAGDDTARALRDLEARIDVLEVNLDSARTENAALAASLAEREETGRAVDARLTEMQRREAQARERAAGDGRLLPDRLSADDGTGEERLARMRTVQDLRRKPVEERWQAARDALSLSLPQEEALKAALETRQKAFRDAMKETSREGTTFLVPDPEKVRAARAAYDAEVERTLSGDQARRWRADGYEDALRATGGGGRPVPAGAAGGRR